MATRGSYSCLITPLPGRRYPPILPGSTVPVFQRQTQPSLCARLIAQHQEDQPEAVSEAKTSFHRAKEVDSFTYHRQVDLPAPTIPDPASSSHTSSGYASLPAAALAFALACSFSKTFDGSFLMVGAFLGAFLGAFGGEFSFAFVFAGDVDRGDRKAYLYLYPCEYLVGLQWRL